MQEPVVAFVAVPCKGTDHNGLSLFAEEDPLILMPLGVHEAAAVPELFGSVAADIRETELAEDSPDVLLNGRVSLLVPFKGSSGKVHRDFLGLLEPRAVCPEDRLPGRGEEDKVLLLGKEQPNFGRNVCEFSLELQAGMDVPGEKIEEVFVLCHERVVPVDWEGRHGDDFPKDLVDVVHGDIAEEAHKSCVRSFGFESPRGVDDDFPPPAFLLLNALEELSYKRAESSQAEIRLPVREVLHKDGTSFVAFLAVVGCKRLGTELSVLRFRVEENEGIAFLEEVA